MFNIKSVPNISNTWKIKVQVLEIIETLLKITIKHTQKHFY